MVQVACPEPFVAVRGERGERGETGLMKMYEVGDFGEHGCFDVCKAKAGRSFGLQMMMS